MSVTNMVTTPNTITDVIAPRNALPLENMALMSAIPDTGMHFPLIRAARSFRYSRIVIMMSLPSRMPQGQRPAVRRHAGICDLSRLQKSGAKSYRLAPASQQIAGSA